MIERTGNPDRRASYEAELAMPPFPMPLLDLWRSYHRIRARKGGNGFSASPIEWTDIGEFMRVTRTALLPREVEVLERLDNAFLAANAPAKG